MKSRRAVDAAPDMVVQTRDNLEFPTVLQFFAQKAGTREGKKKVMELGLMNQDRQFGHYAELDDWFVFVEKEGPLRFPAIPEPSLFDRNPHLKPFDGPELRAIRDLLLFRARVLETDSLAFTHEGLCAELDLCALTGRLETLFERDGSWRHDLTPRFAALHQQLRTTEARLDKTLADLIRKWSAYLNETIVFERNHRKVLAVKQAFRGRVVGILQDFSASGQTVYLEPEPTVPIQNQLIQIEADLDEELWRIRLELTEKVRDHPEIASEICPAAARMDMIQALTLTAKEAGLAAVRPNAKHGLRLNHARHPFLDEAFSVYRQRAFDEDEPDKKRMVPFSLHLDDTVRGLVVSGANTGGKTVTLKTTGLIAWMANSGLPVPVDEGSQIPFYKKIFADIGDHQSLSHNLSTYASHLANIRDILADGESATLVLLDELGSGTDPREGNALARALIEEIMDRGLHLIITTHQQLLCTLALNHSNLENGSMAFDLKRLKPTYRFQQGVPGRSHALETAANSGLPEKILARARQLIDEDQVDIQAAIRTLQEQNKQLGKQRHKLRKDELRLHRKIVETKKEATRLERLYEEEKERTRTRIAKSVDRAEKELRTLIGDLTTQKQRRSMVGQFAKAKKEILDPYGQPEKLPTLDLATTGLPPEDWERGDPVFHKTWLKQGSLLDVDRKKARIDVKGMVLTVPVKDLMHLEKTEKTRSEPRVMDHLEDDGDVQVATELKLLGQRVEDALLEVEQTIDLALRRGVPFLRLIHGHGTGALKKAVRDYLDTHLARDSFRVVTDLKNDGVTEIHFH